MEQRSHFEFNSSYEFADLIEGSVKGQASFWNFDEKFFIKAASKFSKDTLLHLYIVTTSINYHRRNFRKHGIDDEDQLEYWYDLFDHYKLTIEEYDFDKNEEPVDWFDRNITCFENLFDAMSDEIFHILFTNRGFLLGFNELVAETVRDIEFPKITVTTKGTLKRVRIPEWVKGAIFHRDKGRCVFCNTDLTRVFNNLTKVNFDHIVPLDMYGANDPCNLQLSFKHCNKSKSNKLASTSSEYLTWWKR